MFKSLTAALWALAVPLAAYSMMNEEETLINEIVELAKEKVLRDYKERGTLALRDAHPKAHGCVKAEVSILPDLPAHLQIGLFSHGGETFPAVIRFSNAAGIKSDAEPDVRGMALKILEVEGEKVKDDESVQDIQDILMVSHPVFVAADVKDYRDFFEKIALNNSPMSYFFPSLNPLTWRLKAMKIANEIKSTKTSNLLELNYFSMTPFALGADENIKYAAKPCHLTRKTPFPRNPSANFLKEQLKADLQGQEACFNLYVQLSEGKLPLDDATYLWDSPLIKVAKVVIPPQSFDSEEQMDKCEHMSFDPWNALKEHTPMGGLNTSRRAVYEAISKFRHELNRRMTTDPSSL